MASLEGNAQKTQRVEDEASKIISQVAIATKDDKLRRELYPGIDANETGFLKVSDLHSLYWEESGNSAGQVNFRASESYGSINCPRPQTKVFPLMSFIPKKLQRGKFVNGFHVKGV